MSLDNMSIDDRIAALRAFEAKALPGEQQRVLASPGPAGNTFVIPTAPLTDARPPKGWEPRVTFGKNGLPEQINSPVIPDGVGDADALKQTIALLAVMVPEGYRARVAEVRLNESAWKRTFDTDSQQGKGEAYTAPSRFIRWVIEEIPAADEVIAGMNEVEWNTAVEAIRRRKFPIAKPVTEIAAVDLFVPHGDLQAGQHDGDSVTGLIARMALYPLVVRAEMKRLRKSGTPVKRLVLPSLGDLVENVVGFYANQQFVVRLNMVQQRKVARRLIQEMIEQLATLGLPILVPVVPGNHGENRNSKGKAFTDPSDNSDLEVMEIVAELCKANPALASQVEFAFPEEGRQTLTLDLGYGYGVAFHHGHLAGHGSGHAAAKAQAYMRSQAAAELPLGRAKYLITGHFHSAMYCTMPGDKTWIQIPALCDTSEHFEEHFGLNGGPGLLTFTMGPSGLSNFLVHKAPTLSSVAAEVAALEASRSGAAQVSKGEQAAAVSLAEAA